MGVAALALVQVGVIGQGLWVALSGDTLLGQESVTLVSEFRGYRERWIVEFGDGTLLKVPVSGAVTYQDGLVVCVSLFEGKLKNRWARVVGEGACSDPQ